MVKILDVAVWEDFWPVRCKIIWNITILYRYYVPRVEEPLAGGRRLGRDAECDLLGDVTLAVSVQLGATPGGGSEIVRKCDEMRMFYYFPRIRLTRKDWVVFSVDFAFDLDEVVCRI